MADEYIEACRGLWGGWDIDAVIADKERGILVDPSKVRPFEFNGKYYRTRGPLNAGPAPQRPASYCTGGWVSPVDDSSRQNMPRLSSRR